MTRLAVVSDGARQPRAPGPHRAVTAEGARPATEDEVRQRLGAWAGSPLLLCGHTHLQRAVRLPGGWLAVNPGSVGWPAHDDDRPGPHVMEAGTPHAARIAEGNRRPDVTRALRTAGLTAAATPHPQAADTAAQPASGR
ncbi:MAG: Bis(5-nucleosyl)-tetraphosphatase, symmetrical, partial [Modestobacter sp.]|nr:Bis(5-nucleosyl)-tetraphosphatase, symmetrical [Modestobacter sp.]